jgi:hypothetical protein
MKEWTPHIIVLILVVFVAYTLGDAMHQAMRRGVPLPAHTAKVVENMYMYIFGIIMFYLGKNSGTDK